MVRCIVQCRAYFNLPHDAFHLKTNILKAHPHLYYQTCCQSTVLPFPVDHINVMVALFEDKLTLTISGFRQLQTINGQLTKQLPSNISYHKMLASVLAPPTRRSKRANIKEWLTPNSNEKKIKACQCQRMPHF